MVDRLKLLWATKWWFRVLAVWAGTRAVATTLFLWAATIQGPSYWSPLPNPNYFDFLNIWDAEWYQRIFDHGLGLKGPGYAVHLPIAATTGGVEQNAWAFMPGYPLLMRALTSVTSDIIEWKYLGPTVSLLLSFLLAAIIYRIFILRFSPEVSLWSVTLFGFWCSSPVLQTSYAETLGLVLLAGGLYYLMQHRYFMALPYLIGLSITRPGMISFALMLAGMWVVRWVRHRSQIEPFAIKERVNLALLTGISALLGVVWPLFAWWATGRPDAYTATELAWRTGDPHAKLVWFSGFINLGAGLWGAHWAWLFLLLVLGVTAWLMFTKPVKLLGSELRLWVAAYLLYILMFFNPQSSTFRILMPAFPLVAAVAVQTSKLRWIPKMFILVGLTVLQMFWLAICWVYVNPDYTPP